MSSLLAIFWPQKRRSDSSRLVCARPPLKGWLWHRWPGARYVFPVHWVERQCNRGCTASSFPETTSELVGGSFFVSLSALFFLLSYFFLFFSLFFLLFALPALEINVCRSAVPCKSDPSSLFSIRSACLASTDLTVPIRRRRAGPSQTSYSPHQAPPHLHLSQSHM